MRGLHATSGATGAVVAASLGHESVSTTIQSYAKPEAASSAKQRGPLTVLHGGGPTAVMIPVLTKWS
ncbi:MAG: hypothetical protein KA712_02540 [Myxococcales bacterium]|nr:hypothetical protein [Myxococcales bacterium]